MTTVRRISCRSTRWQATVLGAAAVLVLSACGSTAQHMNTIAESGPGGGAIDDGMSLADPGMDAEGTPSERAAALDDLGDARARGGTPGAPSGTPGPRTRRAQTGAGEALVNPPAGTRGRGFTEKELFIGYGTFNDLSAAAGSAGLESDFEGDQEAVAKAIVKEINGDGGLAGRKLVLVFYDAKSSDSPDVYAQAACSRWTEDRPVFAVVNVLNFGISVLEECLARRQTPMVHLGPNLRPQSTYSRLRPYLYAPVAASLERFVPRWIQRLEAMRYFDAWDTTFGQPGNAPIKIGIQSVNRFYGGDFTRIVRQELGRRGKSVSATFNHTSPDASGVPREASQAVLEFKEAGVTHVFLGPAAYGLLFIQNAASQNYWPRYGVSTLNAPKTLQGNTPKRPRDALAGALGSGTIPTIDVDNSRDPGDVSVGEDRCRKIMREAALDTSKRDSYTLMVHACDGFNFLTSAIVKGGLSPEGMQRAAQDLRSMPPASTFGISFLRGRQDGASAVRDLGYRSGCDCFAYLSRTNHSM